jgi:predicted DNA-binding transcriptional regulator YafY
VVHPFGLVAKGGVWYLVAGTTNGRRTFRVSRVRAVTPTADPIDKPDDFDLEAAWEGIAADVDAKRAPFRSRAKVTRDALDYVTWSFGTRAEVVGDDGVSPWVDVELRSQSAFNLAAELAGMGAATEVEHPDVRAELARIAADLASLYG